MYHHLRGKLVELSPTSVVVEVAGVGYDLGIPLSTYSALKDQAEAILYTHLHVREDELRLFGFATVAERELFRFLVSVSGVGPSIALAALCTFPPADIARAIAAGDYKTLQKVKGVGRKLAERMTVELRDRAGKLLVVLGIEAAAVPASHPGDHGAATVRSPEALDAVAVLVGLGFDRKTAEARVDKFVADLPPDERQAHLDVERVIRESLRRG